MTKAVIIEDEKLAVSALLHTLSEIDAAIQVETVLGSVKESIRYFSALPDIDIIFSDVQLPDGHSFEIFKEAPVKMPVIFTTAYDAFMVNAFASNGIDYLLKPVDKRELEKALCKYQMLETHFTGHAEAMQRFIHHHDMPRKNRLVVKRGLEYISLKLDEIVLFYTENKLVYVTDILGKKYISEQNLAELEGVLDNSRFFRVNRQYIVHINYIRGFKPYERVKLQVELNIPGFDHHIVISQENAAQFRKWIYNA
jgi:DNA-binding LytR/AlgR family response regulator